MKSLERKIRRAQKKILPPNQWVTEEYWSRVELPAIRFLRTAELVQQLNERMRETSKARSKRIQFILYGHDFPKPYNPDDLKGVIYGPNPHPIRVDSKPG